MKILIFSPAFLPMIGGLENMAYMLAKEWTEAGMEVTLITNASQGDFIDDKEPFKIVRNPTNNIYWSVYLKTDMVFFLNVSLKGIWPIFFKKKPVFVSHQITYFNINGKLNFLEKIKRQLSMRFVNISCSSFVRDTLPTKKGVVIHNAYNSAIFSNITGYEKRIKDIIFVGRLVSDKGLDTLLKALGLLKSERNQNLSLEIIGVGPELKYLKELCHVLSIESQVTFLGKMIGVDLCKKINEHKIMVVPSKWKEPFGLVALEGIACGCKMVVSKYGGLNEAVGGMAQLFENGCETSLASAILSSLNTPLFSKEVIEDHLRRHKQKYVAQEYLFLFKNYIKQNVQNN